MTIDIDTLTVGQVKEISRLAGCGTGKRRRQPPPSGRAVVVVDRGWIFAGDMSLAADGYVRLSRAVQVFRWESIGFPKVIEDWKNPKVDLRAIADVEVPADSIIFRVPVADGWGLN